MMQAAVLEELGSVPRFGSFREPTVEPGETLVHVSAAAIKPVDRAIASGAHFASPRQLPVVPGLDGVGRLGDGSRVYFSAFRPPFGAMAQRAAASWYVGVPEGLDDALAAAIVNPGLAAWLPLVWRGALRAGETVLVMGATGSAGRIAVAAARLLGAGRMVAAGRRQDVLASLQADATIDLKLQGDDLKEAIRTAAGDSGYELVIDYVWGPATEALIAALCSDVQARRKAGDAGVRIVNVGEMGGRSISLPAAALRNAPLQILGSGPSNFPPQDRMRAIIAEILSHAAEGALALPIRTVPLSAVSEAWGAASAAQERLVLVPSAAEAR
jgi:NADPH:quinone reductase-like Zn-dependent oxidoreductase